MATKHYKIHLTKGSSQVGQQCPISHRKVQPGDEVVICAQTNTVFILEAWEQTLPLWENTCQYCQTHVTWLNGQKSVKLQPSPTLKPKIPFPLDTKPAPLSKPALPGRYELIPPRRSGFFPWLFVILIIIGLVAITALINEQTGTSSISTRVLSRPSQEDSAGQVQLLPMSTPTIQPENISPPTPALLPTETWTPPPVLRATFTPIPSQPSTSTNNQLKQTQLECVKSSAIRNLYPQQAKQLITAILQHLGEFQLPSLGITEQTMRTALTRCETGDRINSVVQEVWDDWLGIARNKDFDPTTTTPDNEPLSPFRKLVVRLIQSRQGRLSDSQQHAIHNFFTRFEDPSVWSNNIDGVIGAVNRESFLWP